ncbi:MAG: nicotinate (nicotinamide) nucleotide adenylyltransferase [Oscillospiraceae bacterium]|nr:nicotinate (nicotinamide) nucleotide adenylyltransferase [Oscillospiraceae bacterium]
MDAPKKIGIFGGTFNPPHAGHILAARTAAKRLNLDLLLLIPAGLPPHKSLPEDTPTPEQRLEMLKIAIDGLPELSVSDLELRREGKSYTVDTVRQLKKEYPGGEFWLLMGTDMFLTLEEWHEHKALLNMVHIVVFNRTEENKKTVTQVQVELLRQKYGVWVEFIELRPVKICSTDLRTAFENGSRNKCVSSAVYGYILRNGLYGVKKNLKHLPLEDLRAAAFSLLKAKRIPHVLGTEQAAVALARQYGAPEQDARVAALLHDCTKKRNMEEQLKLCAKYGIVLDHLEKENVKLLHARTGAALALDLFGVSEKVYSAIRWHTTGKADMTLLEKIIYLADFIEPTRNFPGVDRLRQLAIENLDAAMLMGLEKTIRKMEESNSPIHFRTLEAYNWLKGTNDEFKKGKQP